MASQRATIIGEDNLAKFIAELIRQGIVFIVSPNRGGEDHEYLVEFTGGF